MTALFFRVLAVRGTALRVELWERGRLHGVRNVSTKGNAQLIARRVALAAAELTRQVSSRRRELGRLLAAREAEQRAQSESALDPEQRGLGLKAGAQAAALGALDAWLAGPVLGLRQYPRPRLGVELHASLLGGRWQALDSDLRWAELGLGLHYRLLPGRTLGLDLGGEAAAAVVRLASARALDGSERSQETWSARAALTLALSARLGGGARIEGGPAIGLVLRPIDAASAGSRAELSGTWLGLRLGLSYGL